MIKTRLVCLLILCLPLELLATQEYVSGYPTASAYNNAAAPAPQTYAQAPAGANYQGQQTYPAPQTYQQPVANPAAPQNYAPSNQAYNNYPNAYTNNAPASPAYGSARPLPPNPYTNNPYMANSPPSAYAAGSQPANTGAGSAPAANNNGLPPGTNPMTGQPTAPSQTPVSNSSAPAGYGPAPSSQTPASAGQAPVNNSNANGSAPAVAGVAPTATPQPAQNPASSYNNGTASNASGSVYTDQEKQAWLNSCIPSASAPSVAKVAQAFCLCGWQHISSGEMPANLLTSTNPTDIQQRQSIMQAISEACVVQLTASNQIQ